MRPRFFPLAALLLVLPAPISLVRDTSPDEYKVYEAVFGLMDQMPKKDPHITIFNVTLNSKCGADAGGAPLANGCTFFWIKPDDANRVKRLLRTQWREMENSTWQDFETQNATRAHLHEPIATPWRHKLVGPGEEPDKDWKSPDLTIFLSRVGFNQRKTEAVLYVLVFSYIDQVATAGDYFLFRVNKAGRWEPNGRVTYFSQGADESPE